MNEAGGASDRILRIDGGVKTGWRERERESGRREKRVFRFCFSREGVGQGGTAPNAEVQAAPLPDSTCSAVEEMQNRKAEAGEENPGLGGPDKAVGLERPTGSLPRPPRARGSPFLLYMSVGHIPRHAERARRRISAIPGFLFSLRSVSLSTAGRISEIALYLLFFGGVYFFCVSRRREGESVPNSCCPPLVGLRGSPKPYTLHPWRSGKGNGSGEVAVAAAAALLLLLLLLPLDGCCVLCRS